MEMISNVGTIFFQ